MNTTTHAIERKSSYEPESSLSPFFSGIDERLRYEAKINTLFFFLVFAEVLLLILFIPFFIQSALLAFILAIFVITVFGYLVLLEYLTSLKKIHFANLLEGEIRRYKEQLGKEKEGADSVIKIGKHLARLAEKLEGRERSYYPFSGTLKLLSPWSERISSYLHFKDIHEMRKMLLTTSVEEHKKLVRLEPTNPDAHALLANAYVMLSAIYVTPKQLENDDEKTSNEEFKKAVMRAIEEFKILKEYSPNDPWVFSQLAYSYHDLGMKEEEMDALLSILALRPNDHETRFKLGKLFFKTGENARGLKVYEELKKAGFSKHEELLSFYGEKKESL